MGSLYLQVYCHDDPLLRAVPIESLLVLHTLCCLDLQKDPQTVELIFVETNQTGKEPLFSIDVSQFVFKTIGKAHGELPVEAQMCPMPVFVEKKNGGSKVVAGLSSVLRCILYACSDVHPLLGFRQSCLIACAEVSVWTRFCEVDIVKTVKSFLSTKDVSFSSVPVDVARLEEHLAHAPRLHNARKHRQEHAKAIGSSQKEEELEHVYAEGPYMTLADIILFPCFFILLNIFPSRVTKLLPLVSAWFARVSSSEHALRAAHLLEKIKASLPKTDDEDCVFPAVPKESLYKADPSRHKPRSNKMYTQQQDVEASLAIVSCLPVHVEQTDIPLGSDIPLDWNALPISIRPEGGHLPELRQKRKGEQLANMARAVLKIARPSHTIVDFCSGSGHLGILLAWLLPSCYVVLLENKDKSLQRAALRVKELGLKNVQLVQSNLGYFQGKFDIGVALHACGVATDLVLELCLTKQAAFVVCPCCYGSIQNGHTMNYPRSKVFRGSVLSGKNYLVLSHCADQTHGETGVKTNQGNMCMAAIDKDRLQRAGEADYDVHLSKMSPHTCSPKNNLLVGVPKESVNLNFLHFENLTLN